MNPAICIGMQEMDDVRAGWRRRPAPKSAKLSVAKAHLCCEFERTHGTRTPYAGRYDRQSLAAFAMPAGAHELSIKTIVTGDPPIRLKGHRTERKVASRSSHGDRGNRSRGWL
jgi:hypothetical protein